MRETHIDLDTEKLFQTLGDIQVRLHELEFEAKFTRLATLIAFFLFAERVWIYFH